MTGRVPNADAVAAIGVALLVWLAIVAWSVREQRRIRRQRVANRAMVREARENATRREDW